MTHDATSGLSYTFDQENRITGAAGYTYTYDSDGNRVRKSNGNLAANGTLYWYMTMGIVGESDLAGTMKSEYVFFGGQRVARRDLVAPTGVVYYFSDHLKTASVITDATGNIKGESDYYPWGGELGFVNSDINRYKFTGKERDGETGLDYFGARYYSNALGRWVSADWSAVPVPVPYADLGDPQSLNQYSYVRNLPTTRVDEDGHFAIPGSNACQGQPLCKDAKGRREPIDKPDKNLGHWGFIDKKGKPGIINMKCSKGKCITQEQASESKNQDPEVGLNIWKCKGCPTTWRRASNTVDDLAVATAIVPIAVPAVGELIVVGPTVGTNIWGYAYYVLPGSGIVIGAALKPKAPGLGTVAATKFVLKAFWQGLVDTHKAKSSDGWWSGLED
jgi:RHS repeat-associated protein